MGDLLAIDHIARLAGLRRPFRPTNQIIHGDLAANVLFAEGLPPAVIDFSPDWRPAELATAMVVADGIVSEGADTELVEALEGGPDRAQYFVRALLFRAIVDALIRPAEEAVAIARAYRPAIDVAGAMVASG